MRQRRGVSRKSLAQEITMMFLGRKTAACAGWTGRIWMSESAQEFFGAKN